MFQVGFHSTDITPKMGGIPLAGYGATHLRLAARVLDPLEGLCTVIRSGDSEIMLLNLDFISLSFSLVEKFREAVFAATGFPKDRIFISGTHSHSTPDLGSGLDSIQKYLEQVTEQIADLAKRAVADLRPARLFYGKGEVGHEGFRMNFIRHYKKTDIAFKDHPEDGPVYYVGDNSGLEYNSSKKYIYTGHVSDPDPMMQILEFRRENADSIILVNFQAHATCTGGTTRTNMSSDFPYAMRQSLQKLLPDTRVVYLQGAAGNINFCSRLLSDGIPGFTQGVTEFDKTRYDHYAYGSVLARYADRILRQEMTESESDVILVRSRQITADCDHLEDDRITDAKKIYDVFKEEGRSTRVMEMCKELHFNSPYHAGSVIRKANYPKSEEFPINTLRIGDVGFITAPCEMFDATGRFIKKNSPFPMTVIQGYSCGNISYMPSDDAPMNCYERNQSRYVPGTAEIMRDAFVDELKKMK